MAVEIIGGLFEVVIFAVAMWILVWNLQTSVQKKISIVTIFSSRLLIIAIICLRLGSFDETLFQLNPSLHLASFSCWTQTEMNVSIIAVTIPTVRALLAHLITNYGGSGGLTARETAAYSSIRQSRKPVGDSIPMDSLRSAISHHSPRGLGTQQYKEICEDDVCNDTPQSVGHHRAWTNGPSDSVGSGSEAIGTVEALRMSGNEAMKMIIRKDVTYQVRYDTEN
ncbi:hypothetical protein DV738_g5439, partial [Chaetothyriales sp. CBS 135597]